MVIWRKEAKLSDDRTVLKRNHHRTWPTDDAMLSRSCSRDGAVEDDNTEGQYGDVEDALKRKGDTRQ